MKKLPLVLLIVTTASAEAALNGRITAPTGQPIGGVAVTDGLNVVKTGKDGTFSLPGEHPKARFVTVTPPSGYRAKEAHYQRIDSEKTTYDFTLEPWDRVAPDGSHSFVQITDTEIRSTDKKHNYWANNVRDYVKNQRAAFIVHTGDICYEGGLKAHLPLMNSQNMDCPMYYCIGNHDLVKGKYGEALFESIYGPVYYSFDAGNIHYVVTPMASGDYRPSYTIAEVAAWLKNDLAQLAPGKSVVIFNHDLLSHSGTFNYGGIPLHDFNLKAFLYGHWHINFARKQGSVTTFSTATLDKGGIDHSTSAFRVLHADSAGNLTSELRYAGIRKALDATLAADGSLVLNAYRTVSPVKSATWVHRKAGRSTTKPAPLTRVTDWSWVATVIPASPGDFFSIDVLFEDNQTASVDVPAPVPLAAPAPDKPWPTFLAASTHTGTNTATLTLPLGAAWVRNLGSNIFMGSPLVADGKVFIGTVDENLTGKAAAFALDARTGKILWRTPVRNSIKNNMAFDSGLLFAQDAEGWLYALDAATGKLRWERKLAVAGLPALVEGLTASGGIVYAGTGKGLSAWNLEGEKLWQNTDWAQREGTTSTTAVGNGVVIQGVQWGALYANDAATGKQLWKIATADFRMRSSSPLIDGDKTYIISKDSLFVLETKTGKIITSKKVDANLEVTSTPLLTEKIIAFGSSGGGLIALHRETLEPAWSVEVDPALIHTPPYVGPDTPVIETSPIRCGDWVFFTSSDGLIRAVDLDTGKFQWSHRLGAPVFATPSASGNTLFTVDFGGNVYAFTPRNPKGK